MKNNLIITSVFEDNAFIPALYSCQWKNINPEIRIWNIPDWTESLALIMDDPDAPMGTFVHWVVWNIPVGNIPEASSGSWEYREWINSSWKSFYSGPCPPVWHWVHHYHFKVFALDSIIVLNQKIDKERLLKEIGRHILSEWELVWLFERK
ncbi:MAG: hypothetical protein ACD_3C00125G0007 [uncultured bacterium (gcode 4)]|uniref:Phospholipid-binding protein n=1 Tax=uncultured bacterium (gcode 4) TaxID=1234023 RepID=K2FY95_9BACT|nr:MAG: hypothetical protein ACD_3C00125G0007 [uncultured bacterium (gcode 4)]